VTHEERRSRRPDGGGQGRALADRRSGDYGSVLREAFAHWNEGDFEGTTALMAPDVEWRTAGLFPDLAPAYHGRKGVRRFFRDFTAPWEEIVLEPMRIDVDGDVAIVDTRFRARGRDGIEVDITLFLRFVKRDDLTCFVAVYPSREQAAAGAANPAS
jgi:ketosteroid isomerase-like protein